MSLIFGSKKDVCQAIEDSPKRIRSLAINQGETFQAAEIYNDTQKEICDEIQANQDFGDIVSQALAERYGDDFDPEEVVEEKIYSGFISNTDKNILDRFQDARWQDRFEIVKSLKTSVCVN